MSREKQGSKAGRREKHLARVAALKARKRLRKARAARFAHLPGQQPTHGSDRVGRPVPRAVDIELRAIAMDTLAVLAAADATGLESLTVAKLQLRCAADGIEYRAKDRKADLIAKMIASQAAEMRS
jgi:hypothetical protein